MSEIISICGLVCTECGAFQATRDDDDEKRAETAKLWSKEFKSDIKPEDINCSGCLTDSDVLFGYSQTCEIRKCGVEREVVNCAYCDDYSCEKLDKFFQMVPDAKKRLDGIKSQK
jgi:hypothetical protein